MSSTAPANKTFLALDNLGELNADELLTKIAPLLQTQLYGLKIGLEQFCRHHRPFIEQLKNKASLPIFLDLKLHDIPNTVAKSIEALSGLPIDYLTIHLSGGKNMVAQALNARDKFLPNTKILGVSYLTSLSTEDFQQIWGLSSGQQKMAMQRLYRLGLEQNIDGVVLSPNDLSLLQSIENDYGRSILKVCPGIRFKQQIKSGQTQDQQRVSTPEQALSGGATHLVIGRPLMSWTKSGEGIPDSFWKA